MSFSAPNISAAAAARRSSGKVSQRAEGMASILAIGTVVPPNVVEQKDYTDFWFRVTDSDHNVELKDKFERICKRSMINRRYFHHDEEYLKEHPNVCALAAPSLNDRQAICTVEVPKLGKVAAVKALAEWGRPKSHITHLVFATSSSVSMPSADVHLAILLGLRPDVSRYCVYMQGCFAGGTVLRYAKDLAENNRGARVLVVCCELTLMTFRAPDEEQSENGIGVSLFGDGAVALVVGANPMEGTEMPIFEIVCAKQRLISGTIQDINLQLREEGLTCHISKHTQRHIGNNIEQCLAEVFKATGMEVPADKNSLFWVTHPGGRAILDTVEARLGLGKEKLRASRRVLWEYGNMISNCVLFILEEMRRWSTEEGLATAGEGLEWGVLNGFGPGMTVETVLLRAPPIQPLNEITNNLKINAIHSP